MICIGDISRKIIKRPGVVIDNSQAYPGMWFGCFIILPITFASWVLANFWNGRSRFAIIVFANRGINSKVSCNGRTIQANPLVAVAKFDISIAFNAAKCRIENIIVEHILRVLRLLLCTQKAAKKKKSNDNTDFFHPMKF